MHIFRNLLTKPRCAPVNADVGSDEEQKCIISSRFLNANQTTRLQCDESHRGVVIRTDLNPASLLRFTQRRWRVCKSQWFARVSALETNGCDSVVLLLPDLIQSWIEPPVQDEMIIFIECSCLICHRSHLQLLHARLLRLFLQTLVPINFAAVRIFCKKTIVCCGYLVSSSTAAAARCSQQSRARRGRSRNPSQWCRHVSSNRQSMSKYLGMS